jgi:hypothetical protein
VAYHRGKASDHNHRQGHHGLLTRCDEHLGDVAELLLLLLHAERVAGLDGGLRLTLYVALNRVS